MKTNKLAMMAFVITASSAMLLSTSARSQTYKADFSTKTVLAGNGTDIYHTATITAPALTSGYSLTLPSALPAASGYVLTASTTGGLSWTDPSTGLSVNLAGDVTGASGSNTVTKINGASLGASTSTPTDANMLIYNGTTNGGISWNAVAMGADVKIDNTGAATIQANATAGNDIVLALNDATTALNTADNMTTSGTLSSGGDATLGTASGATANSFGTGNNAIDVMNTIGSTGTGSVTTINGGVSFTGTVSYTTAPTIPLAQGELFFGNSAGDAAAETMYGDATMAYDATHGNFVTVAAASGVSGFTVTNATTLNKGVTVSGGAVSLNAGTDANAIDIGDGSGANAIGIGNTASTNTIAGTTGITGATTIAGTTNINHTGSAVTTIGNSGSTNVIAGGTTIGAVTLSSPTSALSISSNTLTIDGVNSLYFITGTGGTVTTIAGVTPAAGRIVKFINQSSGVVTLTYDVTSLGANFALNGSDVLLGPSGAISLIFDGTNWDVVE